jgi:hypothetical protein
MLRAPVLAASLSRLRTSLVSFLHCVQQAFLLPLLEKNTVQVDLYGREFDLVHAGEALCFDPSVLECVRWA